MSEDRTAIYEAAARAHDEAMTANPAAWALELSDSPAFRAAIDAAIEAERQRFRGEALSGSICLAPIQSHRDGDDDVWTSDEVRHIKARHANEVEQLTTERDLAIAHDRQPYPTAEAYERACAALEKHRTRADEAEQQISDLRSALTRTQDDVRQCVEFYEPRDRVISAILRALKAEGFV